MDLTYMRQLYESSVEMILIWQNSVSLKQVRLLQGMVYLGGIGVLLSAIIVSFHFLPRQDAFYYSIVFSVAVLLRVNLRLFYRQPRPFMTSLRVQPFVCDLSYGNPQSTILVFAAISVAVWINTNKKQSRIGLSERKRTIIQINSQVGVSKEKVADKIKEKKSRIVRKYIRRTGLLLCVILMVAFFVAQILSGIATVDQTCFGLGVGLLVAFFCNSVLLKPIDKHVTMLMNGEF